MGLWNVFSIRYVFPDMLYFLQPANLDILELCATLLVSRVFMARTVLGRVIRFVLKRNVTQDMDVSQPRRKLSQEQIQVFKSIYFKNICYTIF